MGVPAIFWTLKSPDERHYAFYCVIENLLLQGEGRPGDFIFTVTEWLTPKSAQQIAIARTEHKEGDGWELDVRPLYYSVANTYPDVLIPQAHAGKARHDDLNGFVRHVMKAGRELI